MSTAQNAGAYSPGALSTEAPSTGTPSTTDVARDQASQVGQSASGAAQHVARHSKEQVGEVAAEAQRQARDLLGEARTQVSQQAGTQRDRLTEALMSIGSELEEMADKGGQGGIASEIARQAARQIRSMASQLDGREPTDLLGDLRSYARRRPTAFLVGALAAGVVAGRLTRGIKDESSSSSAGRELPAGRTATTPALGTTAAGTTPTPYVTPAPTQPLAPPVAPPVAADPLTAPTVGDPDIDLTGRSGLGERAPGPGPLTRDDVGRRSDGGL
jgi:hypothetical protein